MVYTSATSIYLDKLWYSVLISSLPIVMLCCTLIVVLCVQLITHGHCSVRVSYVLLVNQPTLNISGDNAHSTMTEVEKW